MARPSLIPRLTRGGAPSRIGRLRRILAGFGGVAGAAALAAALSEAEGRPVTPRAVRDLARKSELRALGAGYWALPAALAAPVARWVEARLRRQGPEPVESLVAAVLLAYPHGDPAAVRAWLAQDPGRVQVDRGEAWTPPRADNLFSTGRAGGYGANTP